MNEVCADGREVVELTTTTQLDEPGFVTSRPWFGQGLTPGLTRAG